MSFGFSVQFDIGHVTSPKAQSGGASPSSNNRPSYLLPCFLTSLRLAPIICLVPHDDSEFFFDFEETAQRGFASFNEADGICAQSAIPSGLEYE